MKTILQNASVPWVMAIVQAVGILAGCQSAPEGTARVESYVIPRSTIDITGIDPGMDYMTPEPRTIWEPYDQRDYRMDSIADSVEYISYRSYTLDTAYVNQMFGDLELIPRPDVPYVPSGALIYVTWEDHTDTFRISKEWMLYDHDKQCAVNPALRHYLLSIMPEGLRQNWEGESYTFYDPNIIETPMTSEEADSIREAKRREMRRLGKSEAEINASIGDPEWFARQVDSINRLLSEPKPEPARKR